MELVKLQKLLEDEKSIIILDLREHSKASELYVDVEFIYEEESWKGSIPYRYRRAGLDINTEEELIEYLKKIYPSLEKENRNIWYKKELEEWESIHKDKNVTKPYFDAMAKDTWSCRKCVDKITKSSNNARRIQDIKEMGYQLSTNTKVFCNKCDSKTTHDLLIPLEKAEPTGYETWSPKLRTRILKVLEHLDVYEDKIVAKSKHMIPDHKFSEIRWDKDTKEINPDDMSDEEIKSKFQLLTNQRNQQKREVCRQCYQTGKRGYPFGIKYWYKGDKNWSTEMPTVGKEAEQGCVGCGWYDMKTWRESLNQTLSKLK